jgi:precorrin-8X/cobalt-precorrin-8 methylmutase
MEGETLALPQFDYVRDGAEIYKRSFAIIREEANLARFSPLEEKIVVRVIHASGMIEVADDIICSADFVSAGRTALQTSAPILCDSKMVAHGITRARLPANNEVLCRLDDPAIGELASQLKTTRSAAGIELLCDQLNGAIAAIGNAPTALFHLLELMRRTKARPACVIGMPVGFVGAAESKQALIEFAGVPYITVTGRKGGSAMTAACVNALANENE